MIKPSKILSVAMSMAMVASSAPWANAAAPVAGPAFVQTFTPPTRLGYLVDHFQGTSKQPIVLVQDLHANYKVQKKISGLIGVYKEALTPNNRALIMGREAAWAEVDMKPLTSKPEVARKAKAEALLKRAYISAEEYYAAMNIDVPTRILGIEDEADFKLHDRLTKVSFMSRMKLAGKVEHLRAVIQASKDKAPASIKRVWKAEESYLKGEIGLDQLARKLHLPSLNYSQTEKAILDRKLALADEAGEKSAVLRNTVMADHYLSLLTRLFRQQMTMEEVRFAYQHSEEILSVVSALMPEENLQEWANVIRSAVDYYGVALMRDKPLAENSIKIALDHSEQPVLVVAGGFHTDGMTKIFREKGLSYVVIAPVVESHTLRDEMLYLARSLGLQNDNAEFIADIASAIKHYTKAVEPNVEAHPTNEPVDPKSGKPVDMMEISNPSAPVLSEAPALSISNQTLAPLLGEALGAAEGVGFLDPKIRAKINFVITPSRTTKRTFGVGEDGKYTVVISQGRLEELAAIKEKNGEESPEYRVALNNLIFGAINKASQNVQVASGVGIDKTGEFDTTQGAFSEIFSRVGLNAVEAAFADGHGISPFATGVRIIAKAMRDEGVNDIEAQKEWLKKNQGVVLLTVAAAMHYMTQETGITYADSATIAQRLADNQTLTGKAQNLFKSADKVLAGIQAQIAEASTFFRNSDPNAEQVARMVEMGAVFNTNA